MLCGFDRRACKHRGWEAGLKHWGWVCAFGLVLLVVLFVVRSLGSCFWSFFSWFVLWVRAFGRSFCGSCFGFVLLVILFVVRALGSCFRSFFLWFVLWVRAFCGSFFWGLVCVFCSML